MYDQMQHRVWNPVASEYAAHSLRIGVYLGDSIVYTLLWTRNAED